LDANEQYRDVEPFKELWRSLSDTPTLRDFLGHLYFVEQPLHRDVALSQPVRQALLAWNDRPPIIIDESDATLTSCPQALAGGYAGTSHKNCKGVFKGVANACLIEHRRRTDAGRRYIMSGEDL